MDSEYITYSSCVVRKIYLLILAEIKKHIIHNQESIQYKK